MSFFHERQQMMYMAAAAAVMSMYTVDTSEESSDEYDDELSDEDEEPRTAEPSLLMQKVLSDTVDEEAVRTERCRTYVEQHSPRDLLVTDKAALSVRNDGQDAEFTAIPEGAENCLKGLHFVFTGVFKILHDEGPSLVKRYGGECRVVPSPITSYVVLGDDVEPIKLRHVRQMELKTINEQDLFRLINTLPPNGANENAAAESAEKKAREEEKIRKAADDIEKVGRTGAKNAARAINAAATISAPADGPPNPSDIANGNMGDFTSTETEDESSEQESNEEEGAEEDIGQRAPRLLFTEPSSHAVQKRKRSPIETSSSASQSFDSHSDGARDHKRQRRADESASRSPCGEEEKTAAELLRQLADGGPRRWKRRDVNELMHKIADQMNALSAGLPSQQTGSGGYEDVLCPISYAARKSESYPGFKTARRRGGPVRCIARG